MTRRKILSQPIISADPSIDAIKPVLPWRGYQLRFMNDPSSRRLWVASAQIGKSTALASRHTVKCLRKPNHLSIFLSASERQAKELALKAKRFISELAGIDCTLLQRILPQTADLQEHTIKFPNGSRIIALSATPETARGYTGDVVMDEYAHHPDQDAMFQVAYRQITLGYDLDVASTPFGQGNRFHRMAEALGLGNGVEPPQQPTQVNGWSGHWTDIHMAVREGLPVSPEVIRLGLGSDDETWRQEYLCQFLSLDYMWVPPELYGSCATAEATIGSPVGRGLFAGWDIARKRDLSVIWFFEQVGDVAWTRGIIEMRNQPTPDQVDAARAWIPFIRRMNVDMTGMGLAIYESLYKDYPDKVEGVQFTAATKEAMAVSMKHTMERRKVRLPEDDTCRRDFGAVRKTVNAIGQSRFDSEHDKQLGHSDRWWAACLALQAMSLPQGENMSEGAYAPMTRPITAGWKTEVM